MFSNQVDGCQIWPGHPGVGYHRQNSLVIDVEVSPRAGGKYAISYQAKSMTGDLCNEGRARLTTLLVNRRLNGEAWPMVNMALIEEAIAAQALPLSDRVNRLLAYLNQIPERLGDAMEVAEEMHEAYAWSESLKWSEIHSMLSHLQKHGYIEGELSETSFKGVVTVDGSLQADTWAKEGIPAPGNDDDDDVAE